MNRLPALAVLALVLCPFREAAAAESYGNCKSFIATLPAVISSQGTTCMNKDLATSIESGAAISITAHNVTLDCNDFKLGGLAAGTDTLTDGIVADARLNVTLRNCNIRGFARGVAFTGAGSGHVLEDNRFDGNTTVGVWLEGDGNTVRRNIIVATGGMAAAGGAVGIYVNGNADVIDNTVDGVYPSSEGTQFGSVGIGVDASSTSVVQGNRVRGVDGGNGPSYGFYTANGDFAAFEGNHASVGSGGGGGTFGIFCADDEIVVDNRFYGFGIGLQGCSDDGGNIVE